MTRDELCRVQVDVYRRGGWRIVEEGDAEAVAVGEEGRRWYIFGVDAERAADPDFERRIDELREVRQGAPGPSWRCPVDLVVTQQNEEAATELLRRLRLHDAAHVNVYTATG